MDLFRFKSPSCNIRNLNRSGEGPTTRRCQRVTYPVSYITQYTTNTKIIWKPFSNAGVERLAHGCLESLEVLVEKRFPLPICLPQPESRVDLFQFQSPSCNIRYRVRFILHIRYHDRFTFAILTEKNRYLVRFILNIRYLDRFTFAILTDNIRYLDRFILAILTDLFLDSGGERLAHGCLQSFEVLLGKRPRRRCQETFA